MTLPTLRLVLCGGEGEGKSTLLEHLLHECPEVVADRGQKVEEDTGPYGTRGEATERASPADGLRDAREGGVTIDVARRGFRTPRRRFIVADPAGHERCTRNVAAGAYAADLAVVVADARKGILPQTARHTRIAAILGVRHIVLALNKMDLAGWDPGTFGAIASEFRRLAGAIGPPEPLAVPVCALTGDNLTRPSGETPWYRGPTLLRYLESVDVLSARAARPFRMPVEHVKRPKAGPSEYGGRVAAGTVEPGEPVRVMPSGVRTAVESVAVRHAARSSAGRGEWVTLTLAPDVDASRGDVIVDAQDSLGVADQFQARIVWTGEEPLTPGRPYRLTLHAREVGARVTRIRHRTEVAGGGELAAPQLRLNDLGVVNLVTDQAAPFAPVDQSRELGSFVLADRATNATVGMGTITFPLMRAANLRWQSFDVDRDVRAGLKRQRARCLWLTGLPASGKSTLANLLERRLVSEGLHTYLLDGDNVRHGLSRDLGFTEADRAENVRRVAEVARLMVDAGLIAIVAFISPFRSERDFARGLFDAGDFVEVFVDAPLEVCAKRDPKGLYDKAMKGEIRNFTGVDSPYEPPERPDLRLDTEKLAPLDCVELLMRELA